MARLESIITVSASVRMVSLRSRLRPLLTRSRPPRKSRVTASSMSRTWIPTRALSVSKSWRFSGRPATLAWIRPPSIMAKALASSPSAYSTSSGGGADLARLGFVREFDRDPGRALGHLLRGPGVADDGRQVSLQLQLALHHPLGRVELLLHHLLPARVGGGDDEVGLGSGVGAGELDVARLTVEEIHVDPLRLWEVLVGLGLDDQSDRPLPTLAGLLVDGGLVDLVLEGGRELGTERFDLCCQAAPPVPPQGTSPRRPGLA